MKKLTKILTISSILLTTNTFAISIATCAGCHGQHFEKVALGKSKIVKDMSQEEISDSLIGYKNGTYGGTMKQLMLSQVKKYSDDELKSMSKLIKASFGTQTNKATTFATSAAVAQAGGNYIDLNKNASNKKRIESEDLGNKVSVSEKALGLRKTNLYTEEQTQGVKANFNRPAPGSSTKFERAYKDAPPMIPHSVDGLLPITKMNNQCLSCHMPEVASSVGSTAIPATHFTNYRPKTYLKDNNVIKEGKIIGKDIANTSDIKLANAKKSDTLYQGRFNCSQCHAPQANIKTDVANTFRPDFGDDKEKAHSSLMETMNEGVK